MSAPVGMVALFFWRRDNDSILNCSGVPYHVLRQGKAKVFAIAPHTDEIREATALLSEVKSRISLAIIELGG